MGSLCRIAVRKRGPTGKRRLSTVQLYLSAVSPLLTNWWPGGGGGESPELRPGLSEADITPGTLGFLFTALMVGLAIVVVRDMVKRVRRMKYHSQVEAEEDYDEAEFPGEIIPASSSPAQERARQAAARSRAGQTDPEESQDPNRR